MRCLYVVLEISRKIDDEQRKLRPSYEDVDLMIVNVTIWSHVIGAWRQIAGWTWFAVRKNFYDALEHTIIGFIRILRLAITTYNKKNYYLG